MSYLRYLWLFTYSDIQHILSFVCLRLMYPMLPISLDCSFVIGLLDIWIIVSGFGNFVITLIDTSVCLSSLHIQCYRYIYIQQCIYV
jgi:hypothetical protein